MLRVTRVPGRTSIGWIVAVVPLVGIAWHVAGTPGTVVLGALFSVLVYVGLLLWIAHAGHVRIRPALATFALVWGAGVAAPAAALVNDLLQARLEPGGWLLSVTCAPALEEATKAGVLLALIALWPAEVRGLRAGILIGSFVGLGFGLAENIGYFLLARVQEGPLGLARAIAIRGLLEGPVHPMFTATTGAGFGAARATARRRTLLGFLGLVAAVAQHALWNGVASESVSGILCNGIGPSGACRGSPDMYQLFVVVPLVVAAALAPGVLTLVALARRAGSG
jgi:RsiW-degrading membrane proteinase PrsW (M82 family)